jgi:hypothetical protein
MNSRGRFFIVFFITCILVSILFYLVFRHKKQPLVPYSFLKATGLPALNKKPVDKKNTSKAKSGLPGMNKKASKSSSNDSKLGKPLPAPNMPVPPKPLIVKVAPPGPPLKKKMME